LWAQEAGTTKVPAKQQEAYSNAYRYIRRWLDESKKADPDKELFAASVLYGQAQLNPKRSISVSFGRLNRRSAREC